MKKKILIVDDEKDIVDLLVYNIEREGYGSLRAYDGATALDLIKKQKPDLVILDLMLPVIDGLDVCRLLRKTPATENIPIIMLTAKSDALDRVIGLEIGADDYLCKPFQVPELLARVKALLRRAEIRSGAEDVPYFSYRKLSIDYNACEVRIDGKKIDLGPTEYKLLKFFTRHPGRVYSRDQLLDEVWGDEAFVEPRTVDVHISRLRAAIEPDRDNPSYIITVRGLGYKFGDPAELSRANRLVRTSNPDISFARYTTRSGKTTS